MLSIDRGHITDGIDELEITAAGAAKIDGSDTIQPISGTVTVGNPGLTNTELRAAPVPVVFSTPAGTAVVTRVATAATAVQLLAANVNRTSFIVNTETGTTYLKFGANASDTDYTVRITTQGYFEYPGYKGVVSVIRASGTGNVQVTEVS